MYLRCVCLYVYSVQCVHAYMHVCMICVYVCVPMYVHTCMTMCTYMCVQHLICMYMGSTQKGTTVTTLTELSAVVLI